MAITDRSFLYNRIGTIIFPPHKASYEAQRTQGVLGLQEDFKMVRLEMNQRAFVGQQGKMAFERFAEER
jgi:hypothetical protein